MLGVGAAVSLGALIWAVGQQPPEAVEAGQENDAAPVDTDDPTKLDDDGRFTGPGQGWPPQPRGATDIVQRSAAGLAPIPQWQKLERFDQVAAVGRAPSQVLAADDAAGEALGDTHNLIGAEAVDEATHLVYYSLSENQTVEVIISGGEVAELTVHRPSDFQPELSNDEKQAAVDIAKAHWQSRGDPRIDRLQGFSILAFQPGGAYYDTRMVYVSFHVDEDARPELLAWVDLVTGEVTRSEVDR